MARKSELQELLVRVRGDLSELNAAMNQAGMKVDSTGRLLETRAKKIEKAFVNMGKQIGAAFGAYLTIQGARRLADMARQAIQTADTIQKTADKVGFLTDQLQELRYAGEKENVSMETTDMALQRFSRRIGEVAQGQGELLGVAKKYDVQLRDSHGQMRSNMDILRDFADVIASTDDKQEQLRVAFKLFDSEGAALVNMMRKGSAGIEDYARQVHALGGVLGKDLIAKAVEADNKLVNLQQQIDTNMTAAFVSLSPEIIKATEALSEFATEVSKAVAAWEKGSLSDKVGQLWSLTDVWGPGRRAVGNMLFSGNQSLPKDLPGLLTEEFNLSSQVEGPRGKVHANPYIRDRLAAVREAIANYHPSTISMDAGIPPGLGPISLPSGRNTKTLKRSASPLRSGGGYSPTDFSDQWAQAAGQLKDVERQWLRSNHRIAEATFSATQDQVDSLDRMAKAAGISQKEVVDAELQLWGSAFEQVAGGFQKLPKVQKSVLQLMYEDMRGFSKDFSTQIADLVANWDISLGSMGKAFKRFVTQIAVDALVAKPIERGINSLLDGLFKGANLLGAVSSSGLAPINIASLPSRLPTRGGGGPANKGQAYWTGENGQPELFIPDVPGHIYSPAQSRNMMGGGSNITLQQVFHFSLATPMQIQAAAENAARVGGRAAVNDYRNFVAGRI